MSNMLNSLTQLARHILTPIQGVDNPKPVPYNNRIDSGPEIIPEDPFIDLDYEPTPVPAFVRIYSDPELNLENLFDESESLPKIIDILDPNLNSVDNTR